MLTDDQKYGYGPAAYVSRQVDERTGDTIRAARLNGHGASEFCNPWHVVSRTPHRGKRWTGD